MNVVHSLFFFKEFRGSSLLDFFRDCVCENVAKEKEEVKKDEWKAPPAEIFKFNINKGPNS